ncbi:MAG TPA: hypothetical protein VNL91_00830, partial [Thermoanaerobaculia bacterium]|nr:hypothetical protein [Thermoanaerobaculia bacterium]
MNKREQGYNLVETLIAMALLGTVLISVVTLFVFGRSNVYSGKQMTAAIAAGTVVQEDLTVLSKTDLVTFFDLAAATPGVNNVGGTTYTNSIVVTTNPPTTLTNANGIAYRDKWAALMTRDKFTDGKISLVFRPYQGSAPSAVGAANIL